MLAQTIFQVTVVTVGSLATVTAALLYFHRVRLDRPAIGVFNSRDLVVLAVFIVVLPVLYLSLPEIALTAFLVLTFGSALSIGLRPIMGVRPRRVLIPLLLGANIFVTEALLHGRFGPQLYWALTSAIVLVAAAAVSNLYVQGGLRLRQVAWFAIFLAGYDFFFSLVIPLTPRLAAAFVGRPLDASVGWAAGRFGANIGVGDLLIYCMFVVAADKAFGRRGAASAIATVVVFGALAPSTAPLIISRFSQGQSNLVVPAQVFFGPAAFAVAAWLYHRSPTPKIGERPAANATAKPTAPSVNATAVAA